jgi:predicted enzyme related to lactoylglutathione lyase
MSTSNSKHHGKFVWYDLMTDDMKASETFYRDVIGWEAKDAGVPGRSYTLLSKGPAMIGGLMPIPPEARAMNDGPRWTGYIAVDDVDVYAERVKAAGGTVHRPAEDIPGVGRFAVVSDPHKAVFILFKGIGEPPPGQEASPGAPGHIGWHELQAGDLESAFAFYSGLFGWTKADAVEMGPMGTYQMFAVGGVPIGGMMTKTKDTPSPFWLYYFNVEAIDDAVARAEKGGAKLGNGPMQVPGGHWIANLVDPQGAKFALVAGKR